MVFVNHCHLFPPQFEAPPDLPGSGRLEEWLEIMERLGIDRAVAFAPFLYQLPEGWWHCNQWLYEAIRDEPRLVGFITVHPKDPQALSILEEFARKGFKGVKFHPAVFRVALDDPEVEPFYAKAEELGLPIVFHTGVHGWLLKCYRPLLLDEVAQKHPKLKIVVEHMGGSEFFFEALAVVRNNQNCYAGITGILRREIKGQAVPLDWLRLLLDVIGSHRIIYGTDYPYQGLKEIEEDLCIIRSLGLPPEDEENILGRTLERLIS